MSLDTTMSKKPLCLILALVLPLLSVSNAEARRGQGRIRTEHPEENRIKTGHYRDPSREGKIFSLFSIVNFQNTGCQSSSTLASGQSMFRNGTCYTSTECADLGGTAQGGCAAGFGVCCVFLVTTATTVSQNCSYLQNPSFPNTDTAATAALSYTIQRCSNDICTLRLDFETFSIGGTAGTGGGDGDMTDGQCTDTFVVTTSTGQTVPVICGLNTGYHMYIDIGSTSGNTVTAAFTFSDTTTPRSWDIKVSQIECGNPSRPPNTCLQYLFGLTGRIETFNYNNAEDNHLNAQNYAVCIRPEAGMCCVQFSVCADQDGAGFSLDTDGTMALVDDACATRDYITIDQSSDVCLSSTSTASATVFSRYCGPFLNSNNAAVMMQNTVICDCTQPFSVDVFTNVVPDPAAPNSNAMLSRGVCLEYSQVPC